MESPAAAADAVPSAQGLLQIVLRALALAFSARALPSWIAVGWFAAAFATGLWVNGLQPLCFQSPDESLNRQAAQLLNEQGTLFMTLPFSDAEDVLHPRHWVSLDRVAVPSYAPVSIYVYGLLALLGVAGSIALIALPASAAAAFALGTAQLLPEKRRWLCVFAPGLGFPAFYWLVRPWMNLSALLVALCWAFFFWSLWRAAQRRLWLNLSIACVGAGAAIRPDYAAYLFVVVLLFSVAAAPAQWKPALLATVAAGVVALGLNLFLNKLTTGDALRAAYQIAVQREVSAGATTAATGALAQLLRIARQLVFPLEVPPLAQIPHWLNRYLVELGLLPLVLAASLATPFLLRERPRSARWLHAAAWLVIAVFLVSRMDRSLFGAEDTDVGVHHSIPRYWTPCYLLLALPPLLLLARARRWFVLLPGTLLVAAFFAWGMRDLYSAETSNFAKLHGVRGWMEHQLAQTRRRVPRDALVYTSTFDKALWSGWHVAMIDEPGRTARSMDSALANGLNVFAVEPKYNDPRKLLTDALRRRQLKLHAVRGPRGMSVYRVTRSEP